ncbi:hypothetical protein OV079_41515 [Nannocystis pusilla]|uniref:Uncharacterized protein n=1 Tax=Nannocystis pusilla TaxID=889268 RepID=A0A9X3F5K5_9BACT|nr:hypothetical protein [Nannocystis pusilla]MCY1011916.1 hypothetical protein [Nannocystis pusilla]
MLLLTEDTGDDAHAVVKSLVEKMLFLVEPGLDSKRLKYPRADERARKGMGFNCYKSRSPRDYAKKLLLAEAIVTHLLRSEGSALVFVHVDGDRRWSERDPEHLCENVYRFDEEILARVRAILDRHGRVDVIDRIIHVVPFWSVESWLFQNTEEALRILAETRPRYDEALARSEQWQRQPHLLDEQVRPKDEVAFQAKYNRRLAETRFPARRVNELGLSFAAVVMRLEQPTLRRLLAGFSRHASP